MYIYLFTGILYKQLNNKLINFFKLVKIHSLHDFVPIFVFVYA